MKVLRDYQEWALCGNDEFQGVNRALAAHQSTIVVMATGLGKTVIIAKAANEWRHGNVLCLAHRIELVDQMADTLAHELGYRPAVEQGPQGIDPESLFAAGSVIVGSIQSMITDRRVRKFRQHPFGLIIIDESHRATSPSYMKLIDRYRELDPNMRLLGVTATPNRTDGTALGLVFDSVAFEMGIVKGIDEGWLVDINQKFAVVEDLDLSKVKTTTNEFGEQDFKQSDLEELLKQEGPMHAMSRPVLDMTTNGEQAIIFCASVAHAHLWAAVLNHYRPGSAAAIDGTMPKGEGGARTETVRRYKSGELQFLLNMNVATEGFDAPRTSMVIMGRPTKSLLVYQQMLGRCTRPLAGCVDGIPTPEGRKDAIAASGKPFATVLDFVGNSRHSQAITATDVLGGNYSVNIREAADEIIGAKGNANVRDAITKSKAAMLLEEEEMRRRPMRKAVEGVNVNYHVTDVDAFSGRYTATKKDIRRGGATDAQVAALVNLGVSHDTALRYSRRQAGKVMDEMRKKRCTVKQAQILQRHGFPIDGINCDKASVIIDRIAKSGWTLRNDGA